MTQTGEDSDALFARLVVEQGIARPDQVEECRRLRNQLQSLGVSPLPPLGELLVRKGYLSVDQVEKTQATPAPAGARSTVRPAVPAPEGERFGKYVKVARIGEGGMGEVWKAWDTELGRWVALKFLKGRDEAERARFRREAQTSAKLAHPNIAAVYEAQDDFISMQYIEGQTLSTVPRGDVKRLVSLVQDAALAVQHAHEQGIVHRDIKPQNLMVDRGGRLYVMDFGLAKQTTVDSSISISGCVLGTPAYMSPEQARGELEAVGPKSDVYSLGGTLYELLSGKPPFQGANTYDILRKVEEHEPRPLRPLVDADLETITLKCLEKDPDRRYSTAADFAEDLRRWLAGDAILAHPPSIFYRTRKALARRKAVVGAALGIVALVLTWARLYPMWTEERARKREAERALQLWSDVSLVLSDAELNGRAGEVDRARGRLDEGIALCRRRAAEGETALGRYFLGRLLRARGERAGARGELDRALELNRRLGEAQFERGLLLVDEYGERLWELQAEFARQGVGQKVEPAPPEELEAMVPDLKAVREQAMEDLSVDVGASAYFRETDGLYGRAELARLRWDFESAESLLRQVIGKEPLYVQAHHSLAMLALMRGRFDECIGHATRAADLHRGFAPALLSRSEAWYWKWRYRPHAPEAGTWLRQALQDAERAVSLGGETAEALTTRGAARCESGDIDGALQDYEKALAGRPRSSRALTNRGVARIAKGELDGAIADFDAYLALFPKSYRTFYNRGIAKYAKGDVDGAIADYGEALRLDSGFASALYNRALARIRKGEGKEALGDLNEAIRLQPGYPEPYMQRGVILAQRGDPEAALEDYEKAIEINPRFVRAYFNRGTAYQLLGRLQQALEDYDKAIELEPAFDEAYVSRGSIFYQVRECDAAIAEYEKALRINPANPRLYANRGMARRAKRDIDGAVADFEKALEIAPPHWPFRPWVEARLEETKKP